MRCETSDVDLVALVQGELPPEEARALETHLAACPECTREVEAMRRTLAATRLAAVPAFDLPPDALDRLLDRIDLDAPPRLSVLPPLPAWNRSRVSTAAAAALLGFALSLALLFHGPGGAPRSRSAARLVFAEGEVRLVESGGVLQAGALLPENVRVRTTGVLRVDLPGARLALRGGTAAFGRGGVSLLEGDLAAEVEPGTPFDVRTEGGRLSVRGTRFFVREAARVTDVHVTEGSVVLEGTGPALRLGPGESGRLVRGRAARAVYAPPEAPWARVLGAEAVFLDLVQPDPARPALLEFVLTNVSDRPLLLPACDPDRPRFSLKIRSGSPPREGVANLARFRVEEEVPGEAAEAVLLKPGGAYRLRFDVTPLLWMPGLHEVEGIYQAFASNGGAWVGQARSQTRRIGNRG